LVVDTGSATYRYCIALDAESVSGLRVVELAAQQHGLSYSLGYQGQAVCMLAGVGSDEEECFRGGEPFWGYWRASSSGGWSWSGTGAAGTSVEDGDVEGWAWGTGNDGGSHQAPPVTTHESVCGADEDPDGGSTEQPRDRRGEKKKKRGGGSTPSGGSDIADGEGSSSPSDGDAADLGSPAPLDDPGEEENGKGDEKGRDQSRDKKHPPESESAGPVTLPDTSPTETPAQTATGASSRSGPSLVGVAGLLAAIAFGVLGAWFLKRKRVRAG
jgi:hypothetical protein